MSSGPPAAARAVALAVLAVVVLAAGSGCADAPVGPTTPATVPATSAAAAPPPPAADQRHAVDVAYARAMLAHVAQGLELTTMVPGRVADADLARLVTTMDNADVEEQGQLVGQLRAWRVPVPGEPGDATAPAEPASAPMPGMADDATLDRLRALSGPAFDRAWLAVMIEHHEGGGAVSRGYLAQAPDGALAGVAETTVGTGGRQLDVMRALQHRS